jgi:hypothetical protein
MWYIVIAALGFGGGYFAHKQPTINEQVVERIDTLNTIVMRTETKIDTIYKYVPQILIKQDTIIYMTGEVWSTVKRIEAKTDTLIERTNK